MGSSNLGHSTPGVSRSSNPLPTVNHRFCLVTPGRSCTSALPAPPPLMSRLIKEDFPTLGTPSTITRMGRPTMPLLSQAAICSFRASRTAL